DAGVAHLLCCGNVLSGAPEGAETLMGTGHGMSGGRGRDDGAAGFALPHTPGAMNTPGGHPEGAHQRGASHGTGRGDYGGGPTTRVTAAAMSRALLAQALPDRYPLADDAARSLVGYRPYELARRALESAGVRTGGLAPVELAGLARGLTRPERVRGDGYLTTSDFPAALLSLARATLTDGYLGAPRTFPVWTRRTTLPDFRPMNRIAIGTAPKFVPVPEHAEYQRGTLGAHVEQNQLKTWGRILAVTRQALVNDDLSAFTRL